MGCRLLDNTVSRRRQNRALLTANVYPREEERLNQKFCPHCVCLLQHANILRMHLGWCRIEQARHGYTPAAAVDI